MYLALRSPVVALALLIGASASTALPAAATLLPPIIVPVSANAVPDCKVNTVTGTFNFGTIDPITNSPGTPNPQVSIAFQCNKGTQYGLYAGPVSGTPVSLANGGKYSTSSGFGGGGYSITAVSGASGTASASSGTLTAVLQGALNSTDPSAGTYSDSLAITISYQ